MKATTTPRVFLVNDAPELTELTRAVGERLVRDDTLPHLEVTLLDPVNGATDPWREAVSRTPREGDLLLFLARGETDPLSDRFAQGEVERAEARGLLILPVLPAGHANYPRAAWRKELARTHVCRHLPFEQPPAMLAARIHGLAAAQLRLTTFEDDPPAPHSPSPAGTVAALNGIAGESAAEPPDALANAVRAIEGRLFESALDGLATAARDHPAEPLVPLWRARLHLAGNRREGLDEALREATRAARLAALRDDGGPLERAAWMLATRVAHALGEEAAALEYLGEAMSGSLAAADWLEIACRHEEMGHPHRALAALEEAFYLDASTFVAAAGEPAFASLQPDLEGMTADLVARLKLHVENLLVSERALPGHEGETPAPESDGVPSSGSEVLALLARGRASAQRQLARLTTWAGSLASEARRHEALRRALEAFPLEPPSAPPMGGLAAVVLPLWPGYRRRLAAFEEAVAGQVARRRALVAEERGRRAALISGVAAFIAAVERFEQAVLADPLFAPTGPPAEAREGDLIVYPPLHDTARERPVDRELLPDILSAFAPAKAGLGAGARLHRLEALKDEKGVTGQGASRVGVYFALPEAAAS